MNRIGLPYLVATVGIGVVLVYLSVEPGENRAPGLGEESVPTEQRSAMPAPPGFEVQAPGAEAVDIEAHRREAEAESGPALTNPLPALDEQVTANWEETQMRRTYGDLLEVMHLSPADEESFLFLLGTRYEGVTEADAEAARETEEALRRLLKKHWQQFVAYEQESEERIYLGQCEEAMAARDTHLAPDQRRQLVSLMAHARRSLGDQRTDQPDAWMQTERAFQQTVLENAASVLKPKQLAAFREALQQQLETSRFALESLANITSDKTIGVSTSSIP